VLLSLAGLTILTFVAHRLFHVNATTAGFIYLLLVLIVASLWGFIEAALLSVAATLTFNYFFFPPVGTFSIADSHNWVALLSFLGTSLIASRLSTEAKQRALDAIHRQQDIERLYTFSRAILLIGNSEPFGMQLIRKLADIFCLNAAALYDRQTGEIYRAGSSDADTMDDQLRDIALHGIASSSSPAGCILTAVRLGSEPIASLAIQGAQMPDSVLQGIANLVAIGLERARAQDLGRQVEAARQSEQLRTTLLDALAHEFKTPLTSIKAATTALLADPDQPPESRMELLSIADEEAEHLRGLIDDTIALARLDTAHIEINPDICDIVDIMREVMHSLRTELEGRSVVVSGEDQIPEIALDRKLIKLAIKQLLDNAAKYSPAGSPLEIQLRQTKGSIHVEVTDHGKGIPREEQARIFERFFRSPSVLHQVPGSGLGLSIAHSIARAHQGDLTVTSHPGRTSFHLTLPIKLA
jgi:two-component system sensor histidine kinase KdpD